MIGKKKKKIQHKTRAFLHAPLATSFFMKKADAAIPHLSAHRLIKAELEGNKEGKKQ